MMLVQVSFSVVEVVMRGCGVRLTCMWWCAICVSCLGLYLQEQMISLIWKKNDRQKQRNFHNKSAMAAGGGF
jgi:hypothetical protein